MSFVVDNRFVFDVCPEFVSSFARLSQSWDPSQGTELGRVHTLYGGPSFSKLEHVFLSHLHYDHWGGLRHLLVWLMMFDRENRLKSPLHIYIPAGSTEVFQARFFSSFANTEFSEGEMNDPNFFLNLLTVELGEELRPLVRVHAVRSGEVLSLGRYTVMARQNRHMKGSLGYKVFFEKYKLNEGQLELHNIPKGPLLSRLQRDKRLIHEGKELSLTDVFEVFRFGLGYSGDTPLDSGFVRWFGDVQLLIHETSYLTNESVAHHDVHTTLVDLLPLLPQLEMLKLFLPVHFSQKLRWEDIEDGVTDLSQDLPFSTHVPRFGDLVYLPNPTDPPKVFRINLTSRY